MAFFKYLSPNLFVAGQSKGQHVQRLENSWITEQGGEGQEADHHGGGHGNLTPANVPISIPQISDNFLPCDLVPLCKCLHSRDRWLHPTDEPLLLHPGPSHHAHQVCRLRWPHHLLRAEPSVPIWNAEMAWLFRQSGWRAFLLKNSDGEDVRVEEVRMIMSNTLLIMTLTRILMIKISNIFMIRNKLSTLGKG